MHLPKCRGRAAIAVTLALLFAGCQTANESAGTKPTQVQTPSVNAPSAPASAKQESATRSPAELAQVSNESGAQEKSNQTSPGQASAQQPQTAQAKQENATAAVAGPAMAEADLITVQHILIAFKGSLGTRPIRRSQAEAEELAKKLFEEAKSGKKSFSALVKENTDDSFPGIYQMANNNVPPSSIPAGARKRSEMVPAFGDTGFPLRVGEVGLANYDPKKSPFGWHIIKRLK